MIHEHPDWERQCHACKRFTGDWESMTPWRVGKRTDKPVPLCVDCAQQERDLREDKAG